MASRVEQLVEVIVENLKQPDVSVGIGRKTVEDHAAPPRLVFVPTDVPATPVTDPGGHQVEDDRQRPVLMTQQTLEVHVWGGGDTELEQLERTEQLHHNALNAIRAAARGAVVYPSGRWATQDEGEAGHTALGEKIIFTATFAVAVIDEIKPLTPLNPPFQFTAKLNDEVAHG
jgi:hypothetical protein